MRGHGELALGCTVGLCFSTGTTNYALSHMGSDSVYTWERSWVSCHAHVLLLYIHALCFRIYLLMHLLHLEVLELTIDWHTSRGRSMGVTEIHAAGGGHG